MSPLKLLLISSHPLLAHLFSRVSETFTRPVTVRTAIIEASSHFDPALVVATQPDLILLWLDSSNNTALLIARELRESDYDTPILLATLQTNLPELVELTESGIQAIISSRTSLEELEAAIYTAADRKTSTTTLIHQYDQASLMLRNYNSPQELKDRERDVLQLVAEDKTDQKIAEQLNISVKTVNAHLHSIYDKLGVRGRAGAVALAISRGMIQAL